MIALCGRADHAGKAGVGRSGVRDAYTQAPEALALVLDLDDLEPADLAGGGDVRAAVRLLVQADDVDDPHFLDLGRDQVGGRADDVRDRERLVPGQDAYVDATVSLHLGIARGLDSIPKARWNVRKVEVHPGGQRLHVAACHRSTEVPEHHPAEHVQARVGTHQRGPAFVLDGPAHRGTWHGQRIILRRDQVQVVALTDFYTAGLDPTTE